MTVLHLQRMHVIILPAFHPEWLAKNISSLEFWSHKSQLPRRPIQSKYIARSSFGTIKWMYMQANGIQYKTLQRFLSNAADTYLFADGRSGRIYRALLWLWLHSYFGARYTVQPNIPNQCNKIWVYEKAVVQNIEKRRFYVLTNIIQLASVRL